MRRIKLKIASVSAASVFGAACLLLVPGWGAKLTGLFPEVDTQLIRAASAQSTTVPVAKAGRDLKAAPGNVVVLDGSASNDADGDQLAYSWTLTSVPTGSLAALSDASAIRPSFEVDLAGDYVAQLVVNDGTQDSPADTVVVSTDNLAPVADTGTAQTVALGATATLDATASSDADGDRLTYTWSLTQIPAGSAAVLSDPAALRPSFTVDLGGDYVASLTVDDGVATSAAAEVVVSTTDSLPVADAGPEQPATVGQSLRMRLDRSFDVDGDLITRFNWALIAKPSASTAALTPAEGDGGLSAGTLPALTLDQAGTYVVQLGVETEGGGSQLDTAVITTGNAKPVADAGADQTVLPGDFVVLNGAGATDRDGDALSYSWALLSAPAGSTAVLNAPGEVTPGFTADLAGTYVAQLIVSDGTLQSAPDTVVITTDDARPFAAAGPDQRASVGTTLQLDGSGSGDADGDALTYDWSLIGLPSDGGGGGFAVLNPQTGTGSIPGYALGAEDDRVLIVGVVTNTTATSAIDVRFDGTPMQEVVNTTSFSIRTALFQLVEADLGAGARSGDITVTVNGSTPIVTEITAFYLTGIDQTRLARSTISSAPLFGSATSATTTLTPLSDQTVVISILGLGSSQIWTPGAGETEINLRAGFNGAIGASFEEAPLAEPVSMSWSGPSAPTPTIILATYGLLFGGGGGGLSLAELDDPSLPNPSFLPDLDGSYLAQLIVNDGSLDSAPDLVLASTENGRPLAKAGNDQTVGGGDLVTLDGSGSSDPDGDAVTFSWALLQVPEGSAAALSDPGVARPTFTADLVGSYVAQLIVAEAAGEQLESDPVTVLVTVANTAPVADAGPDRVVRTNILVQLDGSGSSDPDGDALSFSWTLVTKPLNSTAELVGADTIDPQLAPDLAGDYVIELVVSDGLAASAPDSVTITATDQAPIADAGPDQSVQPGALVNLDGSGSFDPDGQAISLSWRFTTLPGGSTATLAGADTATPSFTADVAGIYVAELTVSDGAFDSLDTVAVRAVVASTNNPPVLDPIGNQTVALGSTLSLSLTASDPDGDDLAFTASPLPLPAGASLNSATGAFTFAPDETQVGDLQITFIVTDGVLSDSEAITITVQAAPPGGQTALAGRLLDTNDFVNSIETPVVGATVSILGSGVTATSDANGNFTLTGISGGSQVFDIDVSTANLAPDGSPYAGFREALQLIPNVTNVVERPFFLPRVETASLTTVDPAVTTVVENTRLGIRLEIPPGSAKNTDGTDFTGQVSISEVPLALAPAALPEELEPGLLITIQPVGVIFDPPAPITFPNIDQGSPGELFDVWSLDPEIGQFVIVGVNEVSGDSATLDPVVGGIRRADWHLSIPPALAGDSSGNNGKNEDPDNCPDCNSGSTTSPADGNLSISHDLVSYRSLSQARDLRLIYNSKLADPRPILFTDATISKFAAFPSLLSTRLRVAGQSQDVEVFTTTAGLSSVQDETVRQAVQFDASQVATGVYPYQLFVTSNYTRSRLSSRITGDLLINNQKNSAFGAGWTLEGLSRIHADGARLVLTEGNGAILRFFPTGELDFSNRKDFGEDPNSDFITSPFVGDIDGDGKVDVLVEKLVENVIEVYINDGRGRFAFRQALPGNQVTGEMAVGDFNGDGIKDIAAATFQNELYYFKGLGSGFFADGILAVTSSATIPYVTSADFDLDGIDDILWDMNVIKGSVTETFSIDTALIGFRGRGAAIADFNKDGLPDIARALHDSDRLVVALNVEGQSNFSQTTINDVGAVTSSQSPSTIRLIAAGDVNGDSNIDIVLRNGFPEQTVSILLGDGLGGFAPRSILNTTGSGNVVDVADLDGDRSNDIFVGGPTSVVHLGNSLGDFSAGIGITALAGGQPRVLGDVDDDGLVDLFTTRASAADPDSAFSIHLNGAAATPLEFAAPAGDFSALVRNPDSSFTRRLRNGTEINYDPEGLQSSIVDPNGNTTLYTHDGDGRLLSITDPVGLATSFTYAAGLLSSITDPANRVTSFTQDSAGNLIRITDPDGSSRRFDYDERNLLTSQISKRGFASDYGYNFAGQNTSSSLPDGAVVAVSPANTLGLVDPSLGQGTETNPAPNVRPETAVGTFSDALGNPVEFSVNVFGSTTETSDALGRTTQVERDQNNNAVVITTRNGRVDEFQYDDRGNVILERNAVGTSLQRERRFEHEDQFNRLVRRVDFAGNEERFEYDASGNIKKTIDQKGGERTFEYDSKGLLLSTTDERGKVLTLTYDSLGNLESVVDPEGSTTVFEKDPAGNVVRIVEGAGSIAERDATASYDSMNRVLSATNGEGATTAFEYDAAGNLVERISATGEVLRRAYDELERVIEIDDPIEGATEFVYDFNGNLIESVDARGGLTTFEYDVVGQLFKSVDAIGGIEELDYDPNGNLTKITNSLLQETIFSYDLFDRLESEVDHLGNQLSFEYDPRDNLTRTTEPSGDSFVIDYDELSRITRVTAPDDVIDLSYDARGNVLTLSDNDSALIFTYDGVGRVLTEATAAGGVQPLVTLTNTYDEVGNRVALSDTEGGATQFAFDAAGRLTRLITALSQAIDLTYDPAGRLEEVAYPNTTVSAFGYDTRGRLTQLDYKRGSTPFATFTYAYDAISNITSIDEGTQFRAFQYDALQRLTAGGSDGLTESYSYDLLGNRTTSHLSISHTHDGINRLLEDEDFTYTYDTDGNLESKTRKTSGAVTTTYTYNARNQLVRVDLPGGGVAEYKYDAIGRRITKTVDGLTTSFIYDGENILLEFDDAGVLSARYDYGPGRDRPLVQTRGTQSFFFHADHRGSVRRITDGSGFVVNSYSYDSYGNVESAIEGVANSFTFTGRERDVETGLYFYRARYYDPTSGRFLSKDPLGLATGDANFFRYVGNNPINRVDPSGRLPFALPFAPQAAAAFVAAAKVFVEVAVTAGVAVLAVVQGERLVEQATTSNNGDGNEGGKILPFPPPSRAKPTTGAGTQSNASDERRNCEQDICELQTRVLVGRKLSAAAKLISQAENPAAFGTQKLFMLAVEIRELNRDIMLHNDVRCPEPRYYVQPLTIPPEFGM
ncbi:MAG: PKD domain-containing protein [Kiloniellales bacterium]|nr:PKD domain-containing protein [Kiloniellales bacterium]